MKYLKPQQYQAVIALASGENILSICSRLGISRSTIDRWVKNENFQQLYQNACLEAYKSGIAELCLGASQAAIYLRSIITDPDVPSAVKVRAIDVLFRHASSIERQDTELIQAIKVLLKNECLPAPIAKQIIYKLDNVAAEIIDSFDTDKIEKINDKQVIDLVKTAVLGSSTTDD